MADATPVQIGMDPTVTLIICLVFGIPVMFILFKMCTAVTADDMATTKTKKKHGKGHKGDQATQPPADDPMAWFAGKLQDIALAGEKAKAHAAEEGEGMTAAQLWEIADSNKDGMLTMGEFKRAVQGSTQIQHLLGQDTKPDSKVLKSVFRQMHDKHADSAQITQAAFMEFWTKVDSDQSGVITQDEFAESQKKGK